MNYPNVLKRAWEILWRCRALWVFGVIVALTATSATSGYWGWGGDGGRDDWSCQGVRIGGECIPWKEIGGYPWREVPLATVPPEFWTALAAIVVGLICLVVIVAIARVVFLYVGETALIRMVDDYEETGEKRGVRHGFGLGWSRTTLRLFVIDLLTRLPGMLAALLLLLFGLCVFGLIVLGRENVVVSVISGLAAIGVACLVILLAIAIGLVLSFLRQFFFRTCALEEMGVIASIREGCRLVRRRLAEAIMMWLIMVGLQVGWTIVMVPVVFFLIVAGGVIGGLAGLLAGWVASLAWCGAVPLIVGLAAGIPIFILVLAAPLVFLGGLAHVFKSSVWTLTYRELRALEGSEA